MTIIVSKSVDSLLLAFYSLTQTNTLLQELCEGTVFEHSQSEQRCAKETECVSRARRGEGEREGARDGIKKATRCRRREMRLKRNMGKMLERDE